jgi:hypothetical protein
VQVDGNVNYSQFPASQSKEYHRGWPVAYKLRREIQFNKRYSAVGPVESADPESLSDGTRGDPLFERGVNVRGQRCQTIVITAHKIFSTAFPFSSLISSR